MRIGARAGLVSGAILISVLAGAVWINPLPPEDWWRDPQGSFALALGGNPHPVSLLRPAAAPLSAMALLGEKIFHDQSLSSSGRLSCAACHDPRNDYAPPGSGPVVFGGPTLSIQGVRAVPSLKYLERQPNFRIGPEAAEDDGPMVVKLAAGPRPPKSAAGASAAAMVPQGGLFWDGRADTLQSQALIPLLSPTEMDGGSTDAVAQKLRRAPYAGEFVSLFGRAVLGTPQMLASEAMFAVARYQIEDKSFHPYTSKYDYWLEGKVRLSPAELRGYLAFSDPGKGNCAACHPARVQPDGLPPLFTDHEFEALGVPRNPALAANRDAAYFDLGLCGPWRSDMTDMRYCGHFATPGLRNAARRHAFFHNGIYSSLQQVLDFYNLRSADPIKIYPHKNGTVTPFDDLPRTDWSNVDTLDAPFTAKQPPMSFRDERDIIAFLSALTDGYQPGAL